MSDYYFVEQDKKRWAKEREKARKLKQSQWWKNILARGLCHYCGHKFATAELTMDHIVPISRGGLSNKGNVVPACKACNQNKKLTTPVEEILKKEK